MGGFFEYPIIRIFAYPRLNPWNQSRHYFHYLCHFGHNPKHYLTSLSIIEEHMQPEHTTLLANHVVQGQDDGALDFLMHVRRNPKKYTTEMQIASLESTAYDKLLLDGIEIIKLVKN